MRRHTIQSLQTQIIDFLAHLKLFLIDLWIRYTWVECFMPCYFCMILKRKTFEFLVSIWKDFLLAKAMLSYWLEWRIFQCSTYWSFLTKNHPHQHPFFTRDDSPIPWRIICHAKINGKIVSDETEGEWEKERAGVNIINQLGTCQYEAGSVPP